MADQITDKNELNFARNLTSEYKNIFDIKRKDAKASLAELNIQQEALNSLKDSSEKFRSLSQTVLNIEKEILTIRNNHKKINQSELADKKAQLVVAVDLLNKETERIEQNISNQEKVKKGWDDIDSKFGGLVKKGKELKETLNLSPSLFLAGIASTILLYSFKKIWEVFDQLDSAAADFRKSMGITRADSGALEANVRDISIKLMAIGVSAKNVYESIRAIADEFGSSQTYTSEMVSDMASLTAQFGITAQTSAKFVKSMAMVSGSTSSTQKDMLMIAQRMSAWAGVPLDAVMNDVAEASKDSYQFLSRNPLELLKAAVKARELGTTLSSSAKSSASLLNFTESVKSEMEASVLLGKSMNLQKARELAYHRDIAGLNVEIVKLAKDANFEQLDPFQQDAVAKALGKSAGEVASMLESDREHASIMKAMSATDKVRYDEMMKMNKSQIKDYAEMARKEVQTMSNQKAIAAISAAWSSIFAKLGEVILPHIATVLTSVAKIVGFISDNFNLVLQVSAPLLIFSKVLINLLSKAGLYVVNLAKGFGFMKPIFDSATKIKSLIGVFKPLLMFLGRISGVFKLLSTGGKLVPILGEVIMVIQGIWYGFKRIWSIFDDLKKGNFLKAMFKGLTIGPYLVWKILVEPIGELLGMLGHFILKGIFGVSDAIYSSLTAPFVKVWEWLKNTFFGESPSQLGLAIVKGIVAVESMLMDALISPFKKAWEFIKGLPLISHLFGSKNIGVESLPQPNPEVNVGKSNLEIGSKQSLNNNQSSIESVNDIISKKMDAVVSAINLLRDDMKNGVLTANVFLDSQHLDSRVGRRLSYTGTLT